MELGDDQRGAEVLAGVTQMAFLFSTEEPLSLRRPGSKRTRRLRPLVEAEAVPPTLPEEMRKSSGSGV